MPAAYEGTDIISCLHSEYIIRHSRISYRVSDISLKNITYYEFRCAFTIKEFYGIISKIVFKQKRGARVMAEKKYVIDNAELMAEWNWEKNNELGFNPETLTLGSNKKVWWKCSKGHEWQASVGHRSQGRGCPYCSGKKILKGYNDLQTVNPSLAKEWDCEKNNGLMPDDVSPNSHLKAWWKCREGHEWQAKIYHRNNGIGCPYCSGRYAVKGENDLQTVNPVLANEWNFEKNDGLTPLEVLPNSNKKVWWKCSNGHEWQATIANRSKGRGCPVCRKEKSKKK